MPELPDVTIYCEAIKARTLGRRIERVALASPFVLRTFEPPVQAIEGKRVVDVERIGKRIVIAFEDELFLVIHLMVAGRLLWREGRPKSIKPSGKATLAVLQFENGHLVLTEASSKKRASLHIVRSRETLETHDPGGIDPLTCTLEQFAAALTKGNHTLKRALTNPRTFSGIGNAYSDEILWEARINPYIPRTKLSEEQLRGLYRSALAVMAWATPLVAGAMVKDGTLDYEERRDFMRVHRLGGKPCPRCGATISEITANQRITSFCRTCQPEMPA